MFEQFDHVVRVIGLVLLILGWLLKSRNTMLIGGLLIFGAAFISTELSGAIDKAGH
ncbi:hypothetical protein [Gallaecimonas pentaromativorans]|uniref:Uncharacterized protein n=1 Tax=Gallaecimonas pentaromativorans TaxID=584787 RepID=A0A3N1PD44_9GAMM|nr:hypothetical protein [Gallaecimonas pentaromativorans]MED5525831.1 hypothetical protein [Pseudomonadota bacterium]ROQ24937.1 hypothetical protein EDC28_106185 [Gallaecimonas pentaromativorans]